MKYFLIIFMLLPLKSMLIAQENVQLENSHVKFEAPQFKNNNYYLAGYYGKYTVLLDSVTATNKGQIIFKNSKKYTEGIYLLVDSNKKIVMEFMMDSLQQFSIKVNIADLQKSSIYNSKINKDFLNFNSFLKSKLTQIDEFKSIKDSVVYQDKVKKIQNEIELYKYNYRIKNPKSVISILFKLTEPVDAIFRNKNKSEILLNRSDSLTYLKKNYFSDINFSDERLLRNPFLENKINFYFNSFITSKPNEITGEVFKILDKTGSKEGNMFSYLSFYFINKYVNPKIMGLDNIFINIYNNYFKNKKHTWLTLKQQLFLEEKNRDLKDNQIGAQAPNLFMTNIAGERIDLYDVNAMYTVLIFWDPTCGHCIEEMPKVERVYETLWKQKGVEIFAVNMNADLNKQWVSFIEKEKLQDWIHVFPSSVLVGNYTKEEVDFQTLYNVSQTPVFYLLDKDKNIIAKKIHFEKYWDIINK